MPGCERRRPDRRPRRFEPRSRCGPEQASTTASARRRAAGDSGPPEPIQQPEVRTIALKLLALRPHATAELRRKLLQRRCPANEVEEALDRFSELGYLDDLAFARALVARRSGSRGAALIAQELAAKGIPRALAQEALGELARDHQVASASLMASRQQGRDRQVAATRLQRRGFSRDVIREALGGLPEEA
jgi:regulatory protein